MIPIGELDYEREARLTYEAWQRDVAMCFLAIVRETMRARRPWCESGGQINCECLACIRAESYADWNDGQLYLLAVPPGYHTFGHGGWTWWKEHGVPERVCPSVVGRWAEAA